MDQQSHPNSGAPVQTTSPEEDATLLAIEALEARSVDPNPKPLNAPIETPEPVVQPTPALVPPTPPTPKVIEPVLTRPVSEPPKPIAIVPKPAPVIAQPSITPESNPTPIAPLKPKKRGTPSEEMAEELASAPATSRYQFFAGQKAPRKPFIIIGLIVIVIAIGVAAYLTLR